MSYYGEANLNYVRETIKVTRVKYGIIQFKAAYQPYHRCQMIIIRRYLFRIHKHCLQPLAHLGSYTSIPL